MKKIIKYELNTLFDYLVFSLASTLFISLLINIILGLICRFSSLNTLSFLIKIFRLDNLLLILNVVISLSISLYLFFKKEIFSQKGTHYLFLNISNNKLIFTNLIITFIATLITLSIYVLSKYFSFIIFFMISKGAMNYLKLLLPILPPLEFILKIIKYILYSLIYSSCMYFSITLVHTSFFKVHKGLFYVLLLIVSLIIPLSINFILFAPLKTYMLKFINLILVSSVESGILYYLTLEAYSHADNY